MSEADSGGRRGWHGERAPLPIFCSHFEELQTLLFEAELIINNAPFSIHLPKHYRNMFNTQSFVIWQTVIIFL